jgi:hypothetical protein
MAPVATPATELTEAVIISGPRKGELITLDTVGNEVLAPEVMAALDEAIGAVWGAVEDAKAAHFEAEELIRDLRDGRKERDELIRAAR